MEPSDEDSRNLGAFAILASVALRLFRVVSLRFDAAVSLRWPLCVIDAAAAGMLTRRWLLSGGSFDAVCVAVAIGLTADGSFGIL